MGAIATDDVRVYVGTAGSSAPVIYVIDLPEHPFPIDQTAAGMRACVVRVPVMHWDDALTPWVAPGLYKGDADFGGLASQTLQELTGDVIPAIEREAGLCPRARAIAGYSLGGLFSLYAYMQAREFVACAALSPSVWYEGWLEYAQKQKFDGTDRFAYLSIGTKEKRAAPKILHTVEDNVQTTAALLKECGCNVEVRLGPGNHMQRVTERLAAGLSALDSFFIRE